MESSSKKKKERTNGMVHISEPGGAKDKKINPFTELKNAKGEVQFLCNLLEKASIDRLELLSEIEKRDKFLAERDEILKSNQEVIDQLVQKAVLEENSFRKVLKNERMKFDKRLQKQKQSNQSLKDLLARWVQVITSTSTSTVPGLKSLCNRGDIHDILTCTCKKVSAAKKAHRKASRNIVQSILEEESINEYHSPNKPIEEDISDDNYDNYNTASMSMSTNNTSPYTYNSNKIQNVSAKNKDNNNNNNNSISINFISDLKSPLFLSDESNYSNSNSRSGNNYTVKKSKDTNLNTTYNRRNINNTASSTSNNNSHGNGNGSNIPTALIDDQSILDILQSLESRDSKKSKNSVKSTTGKELKVTDYIHDLPIKKSKVNNYGRSSNENYHFEPSLSDERKTHTNTQLFAYQLQLQQHTSSERHKHVSSTANGMPEIAPNRLQHQQQQQHFPSQSQAQSSLTQPHSSSAGNIHRRERNDINNFNIEDSTSSSSSTPLKWTPQRPKSVPAVKQSPFQKRLLQLHIDKDDDYEEHNQIHSHSHCRVQKTEEEVERDDDEDDDDGDGGGGGGGGNKTSGIGAEVVPSSPHLTVDEAVAKDSNKTGPSEVMLTSSTSTSSIKSSGIMNKTLIPFKATAPSAIATPLAIPAQFPMSVPNGGKMAISSHVEANKEPQGYSNTIKKVLVEDDDEEEENDGDYQNDFSSDDDDDDDNDS